MANAPPPAPAAADDGRQRDGVMAQAGHEPGGVDRLARLRLGGARGGREVRRQQSAARHAELVAPALEQAQVEPQFVFVRPEELHYRRSGEFGEPGVGGCRQLRDLVACGRRERASKPRLSERECHGLQAAEGGCVQPAPFGPKLVVCGVPLEKARELVDVKHFGAPMKHVLEQMERGVCQRIRRAEHLYFHAPDGPPRAPRPEFVDAGRVQPFERRVPELKVQLDGERHFGIEIIAAPTPLSAREEARQMVGGELLHAGDSFVILCEESVAGGFDSLAGEVEIDIVLRAVFGPDAEELALRDAFQSDEFVRQTGEVAIGRLGHGEAQTVLARGFRRRFRQHSTELEREALAVAPSEGIAEAVIVEADEPVRRGFTKVKCGQHRGDVRRQAGAMQPEIRQFRIVPPFSC